MSPKNSSSLPPVLSPTSRFHCEVDCTAHPDTCISEKLFRDIADHLAADGYLEAGYKVCLPVPLHR